MDSYSYNSYARYYDREFPSNFQKSCNESAALREDYQINLNKRYPIVMEKVESNLDKNVSVLASGVVINPSPKVD